MRETLGATKKKRKASSEIPFSQSAKQVFEAALEESKRLGHNFIAPEHLVLAFLSSSAAAQRVFAALAVEPEHLQEEALRRLQKQSVGEGQAKAGGPGAKAGKKEGQSVLEEFCRDLCREAAANALDPVIGRDEEVARAIQILARRTKNNPILLGEPGVGKTAIAEGLAACIVNKVNVDGEPLPEFLCDKRILALDIGLLMAGAKERGELESRVTGLIAEIKESRNVILMIDEVHTLVGAGSVGRSGGSGGLDISNLMKPALARGELQCIGATTVDEHRKYIEKDAALERRFQPVMVEEPSEAECLQILAGLQDKYERFHRCVYTPEAIEAAVLLASRYIADRYLPDKAIDLIDEAGSRARISQFRARKEGSAATAAAAEDAAEDEALWEQLQQVMSAKDACVKGETYEEATLLRQREVELKGMLADSVTNPVITTVDRANIENIVTQWTGVPVEKMDSEDQSRMLNLGNTLGDRVIGQGDAVAAISRAMQRSSCGLKSPNRPIATMLFSGPTGVGKTELCKVLTDEVFGSEEAMVRLDMSEYMERHSVSKLVGSPPGYVGFGEGGTLTEAVRRRPFTLVLLDEIEKAHPDVFNLLLQVFEDGRLTDSQGRTVSFKNTVIVMTSNLGSNVIEKGGSRMGFSVSDGNEEEETYSRIKSLVLEELKSFFRPELLNRLDEIVVFRQLSKESVRTIADLVLKETASRMVKKGIGLEVTKGMMAKIVEAGYDKRYGARPLRRAVMQLVDDKLSDEILNERIVEGDIARLTVDAEGEVAILKVTGPTHDDGAEIVYSHVIDLDSAGVSVDVESTSA